jgi:DNA-binding CsgD family transcriptional regulator/PAS domain-containing protein
MREGEQVLSLVGNIYDAALDPALWPRALEKTAEFVGGAAAGLFARDVARKTGNVCHAAGTDPSYGPPYFETYIHLDPLGTAYQVLDVGNVYSSSTLVPRPEFIESRFYQEWVRPQGWADKVFVTLEKSGTSRAHLSVFRRERDSLADEDARGRLQIVVPHLRRAVLVGKAMDQKSAEAAAFADTLDGISAGMFLVDAGGRMVHANASGRAMLDERCVLRAGGGKVAAIGDDADREFNHVLALAGGGDAAVGAKGISMPLKGRDGENYVAHMLPLTSGARRRAGTSYAAVAALFVRKAELDAPSTPEAIARLYKLTPTELRVLLAVVQVGGVPEVADELGIGEATVKTHLHRLFGKTDTKRQSDLVKLVAGFASPLVH